MSTTTGRLMRLVAPLLALTLLIASACGGSTTKTSTSTAGACGPAPAASSASSCGGAAESETPAAPSSPTAPGEAALLTAASFDGIPQEELTLGKPDAALRINLYQNFLCPHCQDFALRILPQIINDFVSSGKASITFHDVAFGGGNADQAHEAAHCAADQGRFWQAYVILYQNFSDRDATYTKSNLESLIEPAGVDSARFATCLESDQHKSEVDAATTAFEQLPDNNPTYRDALATITSEQGPAIPMIDVGGTYLTAPETYAEVRAAINAKLAR